MPKTPVRRPGRLLPNINLTGLAEATKLGFHGHTLIILGDPAMNKQVVQDILDSAETIYLNYPGSDVQLFVLGHHGFEEDADWRLG